MKSTEDRLHFECGTTSESEEQLTANGWVEFFTFNKGDPRQLQMARDKIHWGIFLRDFEIVWRKNGEGEEKDGKITLFCKTKKSVSV